MDDIVYTLSRATELDQRTSALGALTTLLDHQPIIDEQAFDGLTLGLKACLRQPNAPLALATLTVLPRYITSITHSDNKTHHVRLLSSSILPPGQGIVDRLGDANTRIRDAAKETLIQLGILAIHDKPSADSTGSAGRSGAAGKDESASAAWDQAVIATGLKNKSPKIREQCLLVVVQVRAKVALPLRPILPTLVNLLEDADGTVRETAKEAVISIFTGPSVQSVAKAQLKKEMLSQGVRKSITEAVLPIVLGEVALPATATVASPSLSQHAEPDVEEGPRVIETIYIASARDLEDEFSRMMPPFVGKETEHNWAAREASMDKVRGMLLGGAFTRHPQEFVACLRSGWLEASLKALLSLRTTAAISACTCYRDLASQLGPSFDPCVDIILSSLSRMASVTKTIMVEQSQETIQVILEKTSVLARVILPMLEAASEDKTPRARSYAPVHLQTWLSTHGTRSRTAIESAGGLAVIETLLLKTLVDAVPVVKEKARPAYWEFAAVWPAGGKKVMDKLDAQARKALDRAKPTTGTTPVAKTAAPVKAAGPVKRTGMAALIAARRKEAKAAEQETQAETVVAKEEPLSPTLGSHPGGSTSTPVGSPSPPSSLFPTQLAQPSSPSAVPLPPSSPPLASPSPSANQPASPPRPSTPPLPAVDPPASSPPTRFIPESASISVGTPARSRVISNEGDASSSPLVVDDATFVGSPASASGPSAAASRVPPQTPMSNLANKILGSAARYQDSPQVARVGGGGRPPVGSPRHSEVLSKGKGPASGGWRKKLSQLDRDAPLSRSSSTSVPTEAVRALEAGSTSIEDLHVLLRLSEQQASPDRRRAMSLGGSSSLSDESLGPSSPLPPTGLEGSTFPRLFAALLAYLGNNLSDPHLDVGLCLLEALLENQSQFLDGREGLICALLLDVRAGSSPSVKEASNAVFSALLDHEHDKSVHILNQVAATLRAFLASAASSKVDPVPGHAFGLLGLGKCCMVLPGTIVEEELPRLKVLLLPALVSPHLAVRQAASTAILACQLVLRDASLLFTALSSDELTEEKRALLTYLFDKNGVGDGQGAGGSRGDDGAAEGKVRRELRRMSLN